MSDSRGLKPTALIIDDEQQIRRLLHTCLEANDYKVVEASTGEEGIYEAAQRPPDVIILDLGLPDMDGASVLKRLRQWSNIPVVVLSVREREEEMIAALDNGANDYVTKPFRTGELLARLRVAQRHKQPSLGSHIFKSGGLEVDLTARVVKVNGTEIKLTPIEYSLLSLFVRYPGRVLTHQQILKEVWGPNSTEHTDYLRVHIAHLRQKLEPQSSRSTFLKTEPGIGYRFTDKD
ncbi:MAG TPA: response regulator [Verrucomicrobiae bacterium]|nr:response regulator [Verrucomicrobiae bacterium]